MTPCEPDVAAWVRWISAAVDLGFAGIFGWLEWSRRGWVPAWRLWLSSVPWVPKAALGLTNLGGPWAQVGLGALAVGFLSWNSRTYIRNKYDEIGRILKGLP